MGRLALLLTLASSLILSAAREKIGLIVDLKGVWTADGAPLRRGQAVEAGSNIALSPQSKFDTGDVWRISIVLLNNKPVTRTCAALTDCASPLRLPASLNQSSTVLTRIWDALSRLILTQPERYASTLARGQGQQGFALPDSVVKLDGGRALLTPVLKNVPAKRLLVRMQRHMGTDTAEAQKIPLDWHPGQPAFLDAPGLSQGIYTVRLFDADQPLGQPISEVAWVLLEPAARYQNSFNEFEQDLALTRDWSPGMPPQDIRAFLRACLDRLAK